MGRALRGEVFDAGEVCVVHAVQRCVRRAFLAGFDRVSGQNFEGRREWIRRRLEVLASVFGIDILSYAILSNHMHLMLRTRPDVVGTWSGVEVARRWLKLFPGRRLDEYLGEPSEVQVAALSRNSKRIGVLRRRLSDISWFMRCLSEPIARMANREDGCTGRFWEGRFKAQRIADEAGLLACSMYVDLNPVRAAMAKTPEESRHTSAYDRIEGLKGREVSSAAAHLIPLSPVPLSQGAAAAAIKQASVSERKERARQRRGRTSGQRILRDAWLAPLTVLERQAPGPQASRSGVRASDKGFLNLDLRNYLKLLDWTGRAGRLGRTGQAGQIPAGLRPILERLGIESQMWCDLVWNFKKYFGTNVGRPSSLKSAAQSHDRHWHRGQRATRSCFTSS
jgi:hypothetical protein